MIHLGTYQKDFVTKYARLSTILEMDSTLAQHNQREVGYLHYILLLLLLLHNVRGLF